MAEFMSATGKGRNACNTAVESLIKENLVARLIIGKPGSRRREGLPPMRD